MGTRACAPRAGRGHRDHPCPTIPRGCSSCGGGGRGMKLVSLSLRQWRTFDRCDLEFPDGLIGIRGQNGAGKTTLAEAIGWALFGKIRPGAKVTGLRRQGAPRGEPSMVELVF